MIQIRWRQFLTTQIQDMQVRLSTSRVSAIVSGQFDMDYSEITAPLFKILSKENTVFHLEPSCLMAFEYLKFRLVPILVVSYSSYCFSLCNWCCS